jgi:hypothetical protein
LQRLAAENDVRLHTAEVSHRFRALAKEKGLKAALDARNERFPDAHVFVDREELRDESGRLLHPTSPAKE